MIMDFTQISQIGPQIAQINSLIEWMGYELMRKSHFQP